MQNRKKCNILNAKKFHVRVPSSQYRVPRTQIRVGADIVPSTEFLVYTVSMPGSPEGRFILREVPDSVPEQRKPVHSGRRTTEPVPGGRRPTERAHAPQKRPAPAHEHLLHNELAPGPDRSVVLHALVRAAETIMERRGQGTGPVRAHVQNVLIPYLFYHHRKTAGFSLRTELSKLQRDLIAQDMRQSGGRYAATYNSFFAPEYIAGMECAVAYLAQRSVDLDRQCQAVNAHNLAGEEVKYQICANDYLDARHEVDFVELMYRTQSTDPVEVLLYALVQVKSHDLSDREVADIHAAHTMLTEHLARYPFEGSLQSGEKEYARSVADMNSEVATMFDADSSEHDADAAWDLVREKSFSHPKQQREYYLKVIDLCDTLVRESAAAPVTVYARPEVYARLRALVQAYLAGLPSETRALPGARELWLKTPRVQSVVRAGQTVHTVTCSSHTEGGIVYRAPKVDK